MGEGDVRVGECAGRVPRTSTHARVRAVAVARCYFYAYYMLTDEAVVLFFVAEDLWEG